MNYVRAIHRGLGNLGVARLSCMTGHLPEYGTLRVKTGLAEMLKGGVIMDVVDADQARIAEEAGRVRRHGARARPGRHQA